MQALLMTSYWILAGYGAEAWQYDCQIAGRFDR
jgi:hypothetical protein